MKTTVVFVFVAAILAAAVAVDVENLEYSPTTCNKALRANLQNPETVALCSLCKDVMRLAFRFANNKHTRPIMPSLLETHACSLENTNRKGDCQHFARSVIADQTNFFMSPASFIQMSESVDNVNAVLNQRALEMCYNMQCCDAALEASKKAPVAKTVAAPAKKALLETEESEAEHEASHVELDSAEEPASKDKTDAKTDAKAAAKPAAKTDAKAAAKPAAKTDAKAAAKPAAKTDAKAAAAKSKGKGKSAAKDAAPTVIVSPLPDDKKIVDALEAERAKINVEQIKLNMRAEELEESRKKFIEERNQVEAIRRKLTLFYFQNAQAKKNLIQERKSLKDDQTQTRKKSLSLKLLEERLKKQEVSQGEAQRKLQMEQEEMRKFQKRVAEEKAKLKKALEEAKKKEEASKKALAEAELAKKAAELAKQNAIEQKVFFEEKTSRLEALNAVVLSKTPPKKK